MKLASALEGGLAGVTVISLLTEALNNINGNSPHMNVFTKNNLQKRLKKATKKKPLKATKQYIRIAGDILSSTAYLGLASVGRRKNAMIRGGLLGTAAGLGTAFLNGHDDNKKSRANGHEGYPLVNMPKEALLQKAIEVGLYTLGGLVAGKIIQDTKWNKKKNKR